ncbi:MAG: sugar transferase [Ignavibacterium sp.]
MNNNIQMRVIFKRLFDIILSFLLLIITLPIQLIFMIIIYLQSGDNPIYTQMRGLTLDRNCFKIYKLRTIKKLHIYSESHNIYFKHELIRSVIPIGKFLRRTGLDELPQLFNILKGEITFIGPRPLSIEDLKMMKNEEPQFYERKCRIFTKPGISGYWQLFGERNLGTKNLIYYEEYYEMNKSLFLDMKLMLLTILVIFRAKHSDSILSEDMIKLKKSFRLKISSLIKNDVN